MDLVSIHATNHTASPILVIQKPYNFETVLTLTDLRSGLKGLDMAVLRTYATNGSVSFLEGRCNCLDG